MTDTDAQLQLKKRARRRLVGAVAFAAFAAIVLPVVMDQKPAPVVQDVEIRIPGQDDKPFAPAVVAPPEVPANVPAVTAPPAVARPAEPAPAVAPAAPTVPAAKPAQPEKPAQAEKPAVPEKPSVKVVEKPTEKPAAKPAETKTEKTGEAQRAADILSGKPAAASAAASGQYVILIGAFADPANVANLKKKLGELAIKVYTEPLDQKTRVRAGPFADRAAAEKALQKMQKIGVNGQISAKQ